MEKVKAVTITQEKLIDVFSDVVAEVIDELDLQKDPIELMTQVVFSSILIDSLSAKLFGNKE